MGHPQTDYVDVLYFPLCVDVLYFPVPAVLSRCPVLSSVLSLLYFLFLRDMGAGIRAC